MSHMVSGEVSIGESKSLVDIILGIIPSNPIKAFADGEMLQIIFFCNDYRDSNEYCWEKS